MKALKIAGIGCLSIIAFVAIMVFVGLKLIEPIARKFEVSTAKKNQEMADYFDSTIHSGGGRFAALPLDSSIHDSAILGEWTPRFNNGSVIQEVRAWNPIQSVS